MSRQSLLSPRVGVGALSSPLEVGADLAPKAAEAAARLLKKSGCEVIALGPVDTPERSRAAGQKLAGEQVDAIVLVPTCWCEDYLVLDLVEECPRPVLFWPQPGMETGALCGTQQTTAYLKQLAHPFTSVFGRIGDDACLAKALSFLRGCALHSKLRRARIGLAGHHVNGMTHSAPNEFMLKKGVGPRVVLLDLPDLLKRADEVSDADAGKLWRKVTRRAGGCRVSRDTGLDSMRVYVAVKEQVDRHGLDALAIGCYPHLMGRVCLAASLLADDGVPMACEGDVHGAAGQLMLRLLTGAPTHNTDWLDSLEDGSVVFTHCGSGSFTLAAQKDDITLDAVRLMDRGVCALFSARPGPVTLVGLMVNPTGYQCAVIEGEAMATGMVFPGNPCRVKFDMPIADLIDWIHDNGVGHHWMIGYGHVAAELRAWAGITGPELKLLSPPR